MKYVLSEAKKELLQELIMAPGWQVLVNEVVPDKLKSYGSQIYSQARSGCCPSLLVGKHDGVIDIIEHAYSSAGFELPEHFRKVRNG